MDKIGSILSSIDSLDDFRSVSNENLPALATEIREFMIEAVSKTGGHLASSLGAVEIIMALHRVFTEENEHIVFDVGHQAYAHKILTGRKKEFHTLRQSGGISGFLKREESIHDAFDAGHASTSVSAALGLARARELQGDKGSVVAVIGDGSLTGGMAFEALNDAGSSRLPLIVVLNDNEMSISKNVGAMDRYLNNMRSSFKYQGFKRSLARLLDTSKLGKWMFRHMERLKNRIKYFLLPDVMFEGMGFTYLGPIDGNDVFALIRIFDNAKRMNRPVIIHAVTKKGKGYSYAENNPEKFHGVGKFDPETGTSSPPSKGNSATMGEHLSELAKNDERIVAVCAAMPTGTGLNAFRDSHPNRFFDVGIAEEHAVTMAAGMAAGGLRPVVAIYSSFLQRAYDQLFHDVCLQKLPVVFLVDRAGLVGEDGETHQGVYDIAYLSTLPEMKIYSPATKAEMIQMLSIALSRNEPAAIRYSRYNLPDAPIGNPVDFGKWDEISPITKITVLASGRMVGIAKSVAERLNVGLVNVRFIKPFDEEMLARIKREAHSVLTIEDGILSGGFGMRIAALLSGSCTVYSLGVGDTPITQAAVDEQTHICGMDEEGIERKLRALLEEIK